MELTPDNTPHIDLCSNRITLGDKAESGSDTEVFRAHLNGLYRFFEHKHFAVSLEKEPQSDSGKLNSIQRLEEIGREADLDYLNAIKEYLDLTKVKYFLQSNEVSNDARWQFLLVGQASPDEVVSELK